MKDSLIREKSSKLSVGVLCAIVTSENLDLHIKLGLHIRCEILKTLENLIFLLHEIDPSHPRAAINKSNKPSESTDRSSRTWTPHIRMNKRKWFRASKTNIFIRRTNVLSQVRRHHMKICLYLLSSL